MDTLKDKAFRYFVAGIIFGWLLGFCCGWVCNAQEVEHDGNIVGSRLDVDDRGDDRLAGVIGSLGMGSANKPQAPIKRDFRAYLHSRTTRALILGDYGVRILDAVSTRQVQDNPCKCMHEDELGPIVKTSLGMTAYSLGAATGIEFLSFKLWQHGHPKVARVVQLGAIIGDGEAGIHNEWLNAQH